MHTISPEEAGLLWQECPLTQLDFSDVRIRECFGHAWPSANGPDSAIFGQRVGMQRLQLEIGRDIYITDLDDSIIPIERYTLFKNGFRVKSLLGEFTAYSPNISLHNVGGLITWEFADYKRSTIIYDRQDVRRQYGLDNAYRPFSLAEKLVFIGEIDGKYFVVYDGIKVGPLYDLIYIAYCCEGVMYSVRGADGRYLFMGVRNRRHYLVVVAANGG
jgi:hypothetical protein